MYTFWFNCCKQLYVNHANNFVTQAGPRICLGKEFAYREMKIFSAVLLGNYIFKLSEKKTGVNYRTMINLHIDGGLYVLASPRLV